jgi:hypothetical protein
LNWPGLRHAEVVESINAEHDLSVVFPRNLSHRVPTGITGVPVQVPHDPANEPWPLLGAPVVAKQ